MTRAARQQNPGCAPGTAGQSAPVVGRFAPTPSGRMHLGNALAALLAWLGARSRGGKMLLRIEDLDTTRCRPEYATQLMEDLAWLGLDWDNTEPPRQSRRAAFYARQLAVLQDLGLVYPCFCTRAQLHAAAAPHLGQAEPVYSGRCRGLSPTQAARRTAELAAQGRAPALRVRVPDLNVAFKDGVRGYYEQNLARQVGDFILRRSDGVYAYQLAAPADDAAMGVTQVVRGRDLLASTPRQLWLLSLLAPGAAPPLYCHTPLLLAPNGRRLAKRDRDLDLGALRAACQDPRPLVGRLAWLAGLLDKPEPVSAAELVPLFSWEKVVQDDITIREGML